MPKLSLLNKFGSDSRGTAAIEYAAVIPIFFLLLYGAVELARFYYLDSSIRSAAAASIRQASIDRNVNDTALRSLFFDTLTAVDPTIVSSVNLNTSAHTSPGLTRLEVAIAYQFAPIAGVVLPHNVNLDTRVRGLIPSNP